MNLASLFSGDNLIPVLLGLASFGVVVIFWIALIEDTSADRRVRMLERRRSDLRSQALEGAGRTETLAAYGKKVVGKLKASQEELKGAAADLAQAGYRSKDAVNIFYLIRMVCIIGGFSLGFFIFYVLRLWDTKANNLIMATLMVGIVCSLLPTVMLGRIKKRRMINMSRSLPDALDLFVICAEAGLSLDATFERVSQELADAHPDLADEFGLTSVELSFMPERAKALQALADRCPLAGVRSLVSTLVQTERYGTPLAVSMRVLSAEMRNERMMKAEEKAARLPAIMTVPMILFILPPLFVVLIGPAILKAQDAFK